MSVPIRRIGVVVPAHDEELVVARCLESIGRAARAVPLPVTVMVVLDDCRDRTGRICRSFPVDVITVTARSVGAARHAGASALLSGVPDTDAIWLANTDADSVVPTFWLRDQLDLALAGADAVVGTVGLSDEESVLGRDFTAGYALRVRADWIIPMSTVPTSGFAAAHTSAWVDFPRWRSTRTGCSCSGSTPLVSR